MVVLLSFLDTQIRWPMRALRAGATGLVIHSGSHCDLAPAADLLQPAQADSVPLAGLYSQPIQPS
jgi:hypothetical protein